MGLIGIKLDISGGKYAVDLTKALSYLTGSHVPQGSTVNVVGLDYDSPQDNADSTTQSTYVSYYPTTDKLVSAWRNAFAAHCNGEADLLVMSNLGEFIIGWNTTTILHPGATPSGQDAPFDDDGFEDEVFYNWAMLSSTLASTYNQAVGGGSRPTIQKPSDRYFCNSGMEQMDGVIVGSYQDNREYTSKFAIGGTTNVAGSGPYTARIGIIDAYNKANPVNTNQPMDPFGQTLNIEKKYGDTFLQDLPMTLKVQTGMSTHFTIPVGGIDVFCGLLRIHDKDLHAMSSTSTPDETGYGSGGATHASQRGSLTVWVSGWKEF